MNDYTPQELALLKNNKSSHDDYTPEELAQLKGDKPKSIFNQYMDYAKLLAKNPNTIPGNLAYGTGELVKHGTNAALQLANMIGLNPKNKQISDQQLGLDKMIPSETANTPAAKAWQFIGGIGPLAMATGGAGAAEGAIPEAATILNPVAQYVKNLAGGAASAPLFSDQPIEKSTKEALTSPANLLFSALGPLMQGYSGAKNALMSLGGKASPEEVNQAMRAAGATQLPTGEAINSPMLKRLQSFLSFIPGTGMSKAYAGAGKDLSDRTVNLMNDIGISSSTEAAANLNGSLTDKYKAAKAGVRTDYANMNNKAEELGQTVDLGDYHNVAQKHLDDIKSFADSKPYYKYLKQDDDLMNFLEGAAKRDKAVTMGGEKTIPTTYKLATLEDTELNDLIHKSIVDNTKKKTGILMDLRSSLRKGIDSSVQNSGNSELSDLWTTAKNNFKNNVVPFENKDVLPFALGQANPDTLPTKFIKAGRQANPTQLRKITNLLNPDEKGDLAKLYLTGGNEEFKPGEVVGAHARLGKTLQDELFTPGQNQEFRDIQSTATKLGSEKDQMFIPKNGYTGAAQKTGEYLSKYGGAALAGLAGLGASGHLPPEVLQTILYGAGGVGAGNLATKAILSDALKKSYINAKLSKGINKMPSNNLLSYQAYQALKTQGRDNQNGNSSR